MSYWQALLGKYGLGNAQTGPDVPMIREGDPSRNKMVGFVKGRELRALKESVEEIGESPCRGARMRMFEPSPSSDEVVQAKDNKPTLPRL
jgi:hypothetical protein